MRSTLPLLLTLLALVAYGCTNDVAPDAQSLQMHFSFKAGRPENDSLLPVFPNPFSRVAGDTSIFIRFTLKDSTLDGHLLIQNVVGDEVMNYTDSVLAPGTYAGIWNPIASDGTALKAGLYFVTLRSTNYIYSRLVSIQDND